MFTPAPWRGNNNIAGSIFDQMADEPHPVPRWLIMSAVLVGPRPRSDASSGIEISAHGFALPTWNTRHSLTPIAVTIVPRVARRHRALRA
jgi:hypothetical protein